MNMISVVIPVYNQTLTISDTVKSVLEQTHQNFEIIIADDGSKEDITPILEGFGDGRIRYYMLPHKNADTARNFGINKSKGDFIAMLDGDDIWHSDHLERCLELLKENNVDGIYGSLILNNIVSGNQSVVHARTPSDNETMIDYILKVGCGAQSSTLFMTTDSAKDILWDENLTNNDDYDFVVRYCKKYAMIPKHIPTVIYRYNPNRNSCDFDSCIRFIDKYRDEISPSVFFDYHKQMYYFAIRLNANTRIIDHYRCEMTRYKEFLSFRDFLVINDISSKGQYRKCKMKYIWYLLRLKLDM